MAAADELVGVVGAGRMGRGIALAMAYAGRPVTLVDLKPRTPEAFAALATAARREIADDLAFLARVGALQADAVDAVAGLVDLAPASRAAEAVGPCTIVFEAVPETMEAKVDGLGFLSRHAALDCIVASTTSTIDVTVLAGLLERPERLCNAHWLNPAHLMPLVELSPSRHTSAETLDRVRDLLVAMGKTPVTCKASPGYIVPRIQALAMNEAARLVEEGVASAEDIDLAVNNGFGLRFAVLGLLEFIDWGGGDILAQASAFLAEGVDAQRFATPGIVADNMRDGRRGMRDGRGFYDYAGVDVLGHRQARLERFVGLLRHRDLMPRQGALAAQNGRLPEGTRG